MTLGQLVEALIAEARRKLYKAIDIRCAAELAKDRRSTINRRYGQVYRKNQPTTR